MSHEDLDTVMMEDFGPDIDLLDEFLMDPTIDWCKLEPSLSLNFDPPSPHSPLGPELPMQPMMGHQQPLTPESNVLSPAPSSMVVLSQLSPQLSPIPTSIPHPHSPQVVPVAPINFNKGTQRNIKSNALLSGTVSSNGVRTGASELSTMLTPTVTQPQAMQFTTTGGSFAGFGIPINSAMFSGNAVLLPQLQLAVVGNSSQAVGKRGNKLPVKRLEKDGGRGGRKKEPTNRRSSHNAIERRYRSSINDKILELKNLVCAPSDPSEKVHKAAILRSSIDTIRYLQNTNGRLDKENRELKKSMSQCLTCRNDMTLRGILSSSPATPPPTESESTDSSNPPSPNEDIKPTATNGLMSKSPLLLFSLVTGLFLINPITNHSNPSSINSVSDHPHSRVERSVDDQLSWKNDDIDYYAVWFPRILTILINLFIFIFVYSITGRISRSGSKTKYTTEKLKLLRSRNWGKTQQNGGTAQELEVILSEFDNLPRNVLSRWIKTAMNLVIMPFQLRRKQVNAKYEEINEEISYLYLEYGKKGDKGVFPHLRAINFSPKNKQILVRSLIQAKSKFLLKYVLLWTNFSEHSAFSSPEGLLFLKNWISRSGGTAPTDYALVGGTSAGDETNQMISRFREEMLAAAMNELFLFGSGINLFRIVLKSCGKNDKLAQFWTAIFWAEAEWISGGGRYETLKRLYRLTDEVWKDLKGKNETLSLLKAVYKSHLCKREIMLDRVPSKDMLDSASAHLRDSINTTTDKPKRVVQVIWCLAAEWILECRLELWEETKEIGGFSKDLDTLRSLTHYNPACLPSVYLYEACQRLMNFAAPGRTQQLLDASLRQVRCSPRGLICTNSDEVGFVVSEDSLTTANCKLGKKSKEFNLVREKRKAFALYLKCKYLPNQVITCPGEKAGMLKEAMKGLERIGEKKKIKECLEMIRTLGQNITLH